MPQTDTFRKRYYRSWMSFWRDLRSFFSCWKRIKREFRSNLVDRAFRERLMLAVTKVNQCRYCRAFHVQQAYLAGLTTEEVQSLIGEELPAALPGVQRLAVLYAGAWAEADGQAGEGLDQQMIQAYGQTGFNDIVMLLQAIRIGNLLGNTWDYFLTDLIRPLGRVKMDFNRTGLPW
jgi:AhpD family alkylhydroperoxidase